MLWYGSTPDPSGADEMEVVGPSSGGTTVERTTAERTTAEGAPTLPGTSDLERALALLRGSAMAEPAGDEPDRPSSPTVDEATRHRPIVPGGPATRAYRRLRRIFPD